MVQVMRKREVGARSCQGEVRMYEVVDSERNSTKSIALRRYRHHCSISPTSILLTLLVLFLVECDGMS